MKTIELTQGFSCIVDDDDYEQLSKYNWCIGNDGYALRGTRKNYKGMNIRMHRQILNLKPHDGVQVDHINRNRLDNRRSNLRLCTASQNQHNKPKPINNTSNYKGVTWHKIGGSWQAQIMVNRKYKYLGLFKTPELAYEAYCKAAIELHGEFVSLK